MDVTALRIRSESGQGDEGSGEILATAGGLFVTPVWVCRCDWVMRGEGVREKFHGGRGATRVRVGVPRSVERG